VNLQTFLIGKAGEKKANSLLKRNPKGYKISNEDIKNML
jgi:hypothetical protein